MKSVLGRLRMRRLASTFTILATLSAGILIGSVVAHGVKGQEQQVNSSDAAPLTIPAPVDLSTQFTKISKEVSPAVVNIFTETVPKQAHHRQQFGPTSPEGPDNGNGGEGDDDQGQGGLQDFFNHFFGMGPGMGQQPDENGQVREALGSGFIVDPHGYIITNNHVVEGATSILVKLSTDPEGSAGRPATVIGVDKDTDLAVIKIKTDTPLPTVKLGNSDGAQVGDWVIAIGSPLALSKTVTAGIVSAKNRTIGEGDAGQFQHFIQTDAAINPGNSGGPLVNMAGQVIGVNTAIYTQSGGYQGIGFAMPSNTVIDIYNQLIGPEHKVVRGSIGIQFQPNLPPAVAHVYGFSSGVLVSRVTPGGAAARAGLKQGDIIVSVNGQSIKDGDDLVDIISAKRPGTSVHLGYIRNGQHQTADVTIMNRMDLEKLLAGGPSENNGESGNAEPSQVKLGISVTDLPQGAPAGLHGVLIQSVTPGSFADTQLGMTGFEGWIITAINTHPVHNVQEFRTIVAGLHSGEDVALQLVDPQHPNAGSEYVGGTLP